MEVRPGIWLGRQWGRAVRVMQGQDLVCIVQATQDWGRVCIVQVVLDWGQVGSVQVIRDQCLVHTVVASVMRDSAAADFG